MIRPIIFAAMLLTASAAHAQIAGCPAVTPACDALENPSVYVISADTQVPFLHKIGHKLAQQTTGAVSVVYYPAGSCQNITAMYSATPTFLAGTGGGPFFIPADAAFDE